MNTGQPNTPNAYWIIAGSDPKTHYKHATRDCRAFASTTATPVARPPSAVTDYDVCGHCHNTTDSHETVVVTSRASPRVYHTRADCPAQPSRAHEITLQTARLRGLRECEVCQDGLEPGAPTGTTCPQCGGTAAPPGLRRPTRDRGRRRRPRGERLMSADQPTTPSRETSTPTSLDVLADADPEEVGRDA